MTFFAPEEPYRTPQLVLRGYRAEDGELLREAVVASYEHLQPWMPWAVPEQSPDEARALVHRFRANWLLREDFTIAIVAPDGATQLGGCGYHLRNGGLEARSAEMGMWIRASHAGQGLGLAALQGLITWGFTVWPWERLTWKCDTRNLASRRIAEKAGMRHEGVLRSDVPVEGGRRDTDCFGILKSEWRRD